MFKLLEKIWAWFAGLFSKKEEQAPVVTPPPAVVEDPSTTFTGWIKDDADARDQVYKVEEK